MSPESRWDYDGQDEKLRQWLRREKEWDRRLGVWNDRILAWIQKGGDDNKPVEWEEQIRQELREN